MGGDNISTATTGKVLDDACVCIGDDKNGKGGPQSEEYGKIRVITESNKRLGWPVGGGGDPICTQPDPREEGEECDLMEDARVFDILLRANNDASGGSTDLIPVPWIIGRIQKTTT
jgi:hypothetical protein